MRSKIIFNLNLACDLGLGHSDLGHIHDTMKLFPSDIKSCLMGGGGGGGITNNPQSFAYFDLCYMVWSVF